MAKQTLSLTLEPQTIENIRKMAAEELRTVSNMIEYIVAQYMISKEASDSTKHSRAAVFGEQIVVSNFADTQDVLKKNIHNELIIRPARNSASGEFAEYILEDLVAQGLSGEELVKEFKNRQTKVRSAVEAMIAETDEVAMGKGEFYTYDDIFGSKAD